MKQLYQGPESSATPVYANSAMSQQIGRLFAGSSCFCIGEEGGLASNNSEPNNSFFDGKAA